MDDTTVQTPAGCADVRAACSAHLDGEESPIAPAAVDLHLASCGECRTWVASAGELHRRVRLAPAPTVPDVSDAVLTAVGTERRRTRFAPAPFTAADRGVRLALALIALVQIGVALPALLLGEDAGLPAHTARHLGSFAVALGVGYLVAAWRPSRITGLFPVAAAVVICLLVSSALDVASGSATAASEIAHAPELVGLAALWLLARAERPAVLPLRTA
jgi:predicted anti-sigma-YlaC factor YlaD